MSRPPPTGPSLCLTTDSCRSLELHAPGSGKRLPCGGYAQAGHSPCGLQALQISGQEAAVTAPCDMRLYMHIRCCANVHNCPTKLVPASVYASGSGWASSRRWWGPRWSGWPSRSIGRGRWKLREASWTSWHVSAQDIVLHSQQIGLVCRQRLGKLKALLGPMLERVAELKERPQALDCAQLSDSAMFLIAKVCASLAATVSGLQAAARQAQGAGGAHARAGCRVERKAASAGSCAQLPGHRGQERQRLGGHQALGKPHAAAWSACSGPAHVVCAHAWHQAETSHTSHKKSARAALELASLLLGPAIGQLPAKPTHACKSVRGPEISAR